MRVAFILLLGLLSACERQTPLPPQGPVQRVALEEGNSRQAMAEVSPDTSDAGWTVTDNGQAIRFRRYGRAAPPDAGLRRGCRAARIHHHPPRQAYPGQTALFPVIGNGIISRFLVDAMLAHRR